MCPSSADVTSAEVTPADVTTETVPPPKEPGAPEHPAWRRSRFISGPLRGILIAAVLALIVAVFLLTRSNHNIQQGSGNAKLSGTANDGGQALRLKGTTEAVETRAILAPVLSGQQVGSLTITRLTQAGTRV